MQSVRWKNVITGQRVSARSVNRTSIWATCAVKAMMEQQCWTASFVDWSQRSAWKIAPIWATSAVITVMKRHYWTETVSTEDREGAHMGYVCSHWDDETSLLDRDGQYGGKTGHPYRLRKSVRWWNDIAGQHEGETWHQYGLCMQSKMMEQHYWTENCQHRG